MGICCPALSPDSATLEMSTPCSEAMKPRTEKTTKPAKKLVQLLIAARMQASLRAERVRGCRGTRRRDAPQPAQPYL